MSLPTAIMKAVSPRIVSVNGSAKPMCCSCRRTLDMVAAGWKPIVGNYLGRVTKPAFSKRCARPGRAVGAAHRPPQERRHDPRSRAAARQHGLAARAAPSRGRRCHRHDTEVRPRPCPNSSSPTKMKPLPISMTSSHISSLPNDRSLRGGFGRPASHVNGGHGPWRGRGEPGRV